MMPPFVAARLAVRQLVREPLFAATLIVPLAIGIASTTAIFTVARGVLLRPLPYARPDRLASVQEYQAGTHGGGEIAHANLERYRAARSLAGVTAFTYMEAVLSDIDQPERIIGAAIDGEFATVMGAHVLLGRDIQPGDAGQTPAAVAIISHRLWRARYNADPSFIGRSIIIDGSAHTLVGVMPPAFEFPRNPAMSRDVDVWVPRERPTPMMERRGARTLTTIARLKDGASLAHAQAELAALATLAAQESAAVNEGWRTRVVPLRDTMSGAVRPALVALGYCVAVLLVIAWTNAIAAALARLSHRRASFEVRLALGAGIRRLRHLIANELLAAALLALSMAVPLSVVLRDVLLRLAPVAIPRMGGIALDAQTLAFAAAVALASAAVVGAGAFVWLGRLDSQSVVSCTARTVVGSAGRRRAIGTFITVQIALGTILFGVTSRMYANYSDLNRIDPGFSTANITTVTVPLRGARYRERASRSMLTTRLLDRVRALPGVGSAAVTSLLPLSGGLMSAPYAVGGSLPDSSHVAALRAVSDDFFATFGIAIEGRPILSTDDEGTPPVIVVNKAFARQSVRDTAVIGAHVRVRAPGTDSAQAFEIVGIAADARERDLTSPPTPIIYFSNKQASFPRTVLAVKSADALPLPAIREALRELDPSLALDDVATLSSRVRSTYAVQSFVLALVAMFALSSAMLIAVGIYGSVSFVVASEMRNIGVRIALGSTPARMLASVIGRTTAFGTAGALAGLASVMLLLRALSLESLIGTGHALAVLGGCATVLLAAAASVLPARRASAADPSSLLRN